MDAQMNEIFAEAFNQFLSEERPNIRNGVAERNLCGRLAIYLENAKNNAGLSAYYSDTEYNRKQNGKVKTILDDEMQVVVINCDLILHSRGEIVERDNLIAIEMKKANRPQAEKDRDRARLRAMTKTTYDDIWSYDGETHPEHVCGYELGIYIELDVSGEKYLVEEFRSGDSVKDYSGKL